MSEERRDFWREAYLTAMDTFTKSILEDENAIFSKAIQRARGLAKELASEMLADYRSSLGDIAEIWERGGQPQKDSEEPVESTIATEFPMQPIELDLHGVVRFKANKVVEVLAAHAHSTGLDLNRLAVTVDCYGASQRDWEQFSQLTGYSVSGYGDLSYVRTSVIERADKIASELLKLKEESDDV